MYRSDAEEEVLHHASAIHAPKVDERNPAFGGRLENSVEMSIESEVTNSLIEQNCVLISRMFISSVEERAV